MNRLRKRDQDTVNSYCIMFEGLCNSLGTDIIGMSTIVPLFLSSIGASLSQIGSLSTIQSAMGTAVPLLMGGTVAAVSDKRRMSMLINGISRSSFLLIPLGLFLGLRPKAELTLFFIVIFFYYLMQPVTGLIWSYLLGACVPNQKRGRLLGTLFGLSGLLTFISSTIIKWIRSSAFSESIQYAMIFSLGGTIMACSVLFFIPLRERTAVEAPKRIGFQVYIRELLSCFRNRLFCRLLVANAFSSAAVIINTFYLIFAQNRLGLGADKVSNLIIVQTLGLMAGGFTTGHISGKYGIKRTLQLIESLELLVPVMGLLALYGNPYFLAAVSLFTIGFIKSGTSAYQAYLLEIIPTQKSVFHIVAKNLVLLPFSFSGVLIGAIITRYSNGPAFIIQMVMAVLALTMVCTLRLNVFRKS